MVSRCALHHYHILHERVLSMLFRFSHTTLHESHIVQKNQVGELRSSFSSIRVREIVGSIPCLELSNILSCCFTRCQATIVTFTVLVHEQDQLTSEYMTNLTLCMITSPEPVRLFIAFNTLDLLQSKYAFKCYAS